MKIGKREDRPVPVQAQVVRPDLDPVHPVLRQDPVDNPRKAVAHDYGLDLVGARQVDDRPKGGVDPDGVQIILQGGPGHPHPRELPLEAFARTDLARLPGGFRLPPVIVDREAADDVIQDVEIGDGVVEVKIDLEVPGSVHRASRNSIMTWPTFSRSWSAVTT